MISKIHNLKVGVSGVRGIVGDTLTPSLAAGFAAAFGQYLGGGRVVVGRDTRPSGRMLEHAVVSGLLSVGCQPVLLGIVPTPTIMICVDEHKANGGIAVTASHNPAEWNALKFIGPSAVFLNETETAELLDIYNQPDIFYVKESEYRQIKTLENAVSIHFERIMKNIDAAAIKKAHLKVAVDCCNGVGAYYSRQFLESLGCEVLSIFDEKDGIFRRRPEPIVENISGLCKLVKESGCAIGFAQDPDGDRIAVVDNNGSPIGEQYSLVLAAEHILSKTPGEVVANIQTTKAVQDVVQKYGCGMHYSMVGEINVTKQMLAINAIAGGEGNSGGVIWPAVHTCRDSFSAMALILEMIVQRGQTLSQIMENLPHYSISNMKFPCSGSEARSIIRQITDKYRSLKPYTVDGLRINFPDAWVLMRYSITEPVLRCSIEAATQEKTMEYRKTFEAEILKLMKKG